MDFMSIIGFILGTILMIYGIKSGGDLTSFYDYGSILITIGGTVTALMMHFPLKILIKIPKYIKIVLMPPKYKPKEYINQIVELAKEARRSGNLALENRVDEIKDNFMKSGILLIVDAIEPEKVRSILEGDLLSMEDRHKEGQNLFERAAAYAPGFGMLGTLIGLINMLRELNDVDKLGINMSIALITTFYGSLIANLVCLPIAGKLKIRHSEEMLCKQIMLEGLLSIQAGENYRVIEEKLLAYLPYNERKEPEPVQKEKVQKSA